MHRDYRKSARKMILSFLKDREIEESGPVSFSEIARHLKQTCSLEDLEKLLNELYLDGKIEVKKEGSEYTYQLASGKGRTSNPKGFRCLSRSPSEVRLLVSDVILVFTRKEDGSMRTDRCTLGGNIDNSLYVPGPKLLEALHTADYLMDDEKRKQSVRAKTRLSSFDKSLTGEESETDMNEPVTPKPECGRPTADGSPCKRTVCEWGEPCPQHTREVRNKRAGKILRGIMIEVREQEKQLSLPFR